jgi:hypothetical protein
MISCCNYDLAIFLLDRLHVISNKIECMLQQLKNEIEELERMLNEQCTLNDCLPHLHEFNNHSTERANCLFITMENCISTLSILMDSL